MLGQATGKPPTSFQSSAPFEFEDLRGLVSGSIPAASTNIEDEVVYQNLLVSTPILDSPQMAWYGHPRIYGFRVGFRF